jgi:hypothetical protein
MNFPLLNRLELPILQELAATGGAEDVRFLYARLVGYFPQLDASDIKNGNFEKWRMHVQRAGRELDEQGLIRRARGFWTLTEAGRRFVENENHEFVVESKEFAGSTQNEISHTEIQNMLCEIGDILGFYAQKEFEYYDVVWRANAKHPRLSHVFEVQHKGNLDSAFAKLKKAYESQRSQPFLILASERDTNRALRSISHETSGAFHELAEVLTILSFPQIEQLHSSLKSISHVLPFFLTK